MKLRLIREDEASSGIESVQRRLRPKMNVRQSGAMSCLQLAIEQLRIGAGRFEEIPIDALEVAVDILIADNRLDPMDCRCMTFRRQSCALLAVEALQREVTLVQHIRQ